MAAAGGAADVGKLGEGFKPQTMYELRPQEGHMHTDDDCHMCIYTKLHTEEQQSMNRLL
jgi:hypothetical protein